MALMSCWLSWWLISCSLLHQRVVLGGHQLAGLLGGLLGVAEALGAALLLQGLQLLLLVGEARALVVALLDRQILHAGAVVQLLLQVGQLQVQQCQLGIELHLLGAAHAVPGVEASADLLAALIGAAHVGLGPLRQGLQAGDLAAYGAEGLLGILHVGHALSGWRLSSSARLMVAYSLLSCSGPLSWARASSLAPDLFQFAGQGAYPLCQRLGLGLLLFDAVEQGQGIGQKLLIRLLADGEGLGLAEGIERPLYCGALGQVLRHGLRGAEADE